MRRTTGSGFFFLLLFAYLIVGLGARPASAAPCEGMNGGPGDLDGDGFAAVADCDDDDDGIWSPVGEVSHMLVPAGVSARHTVIWEAPADLGGNSVTLTYDLLRSSVRSNFLDHPSVTCIEPSGVDTQATDPTIPPPGVTFYYLARGRSQCGPGRLGTTSAGLERAGRDCDCTQLCDDANACTKDTCSNGTCAHAAIPPEVELATPGTSTCAGQAARLKAIVRDAGALTYEWRQVGGPVVGTNSPVLELPSVSAGDDGHAYTVTVTDGCGATTSDPAVLTVFADPHSCQGGIDGEEPPNGASGRDACNNKLLVGGEVHAVQARSGEYVVTATDLSIPGLGLDFVWTRDYRSREWRSTAMGIGWTHGHDRWVAPDPGAPGHLLLHTGDGRIDSYSPSLTGCWETPGYFRTLCPEPGGGYALTFADKKVWTFAPLDGSPAAGFIVQARDAYGNAMAYDYDTTGKLTAITDTLGRDIHLAYDVRNRVASLTDFGGREWTYAYYDGVESGGSLDDLKSVTRPAVVGSVTGNDTPDGTTTVYTYSQGSSVGQLDHNLLTVTDAEGVTWLWNAYTTTENAADPRFDRIERQLTLDGMSSWIYVALNPGDEDPAVSMTVCKDPSGNVARDYFDAAGHVVLSRRHSGRSPQLDRPTDGTQNAPGAPLRMTDPPTFDTRYTYNADSLVASVLNPAGDSVELDYDSSNPNARLRGNQIHRSHYPGTAGGDQTELEESWTYGTDFGSTWGDEYDADPGDDFAVERDLDSEDCDDRDDDPFPETARIRQLEPTKLEYPNLSVEWQEVVVKRGITNDMGMWGSMRQIQVMRGVAVDDGLWYLHARRGITNDMGLRGSMRLRATSVDARHLPNWGGKRGITNDMGLLGSALSIDERELTTGADWDYIFHKGITGGCSTGRGVAALNGAYVRRGVVTGCAPGMYCPSARRPSKSHCKSVVSESGGLFTLAGRRGVVSGCGGGNYCPTAKRIVTSSCDAGYFSPLPSAARRGVVSGCGGGNYCPTGRRGVVSGCGGGNYCPSAARRGIVKGCGGGSYCPAATYTDPAGRSWSMEYDAGGSLTVLTAPPVVTGTLSGTVQTIESTCAYDAQGRVTQCTSPEGRVDEFHYHTSGPATGYLKDVVIDAPNEALTTTTNRNRYGDVVQVISAANSADFDVDARGRVQRLRLSLPYPRQKFFYYDRNDQVVRTDVENLDEDGLVSSTNPYITTTLEKEPIFPIVVGRMETAPGECVSEELSWDAASSSLKKKSGLSFSGAQPTATTMIAFDAVRLPYRLTDSTGDPVQVTLQFDYDGNQRLVTVHDALEDSAGPSISSASYDGYGRPVTTTDPEGNTASLHYDPNGNPVSLVLEGELMEGSSGTNVVLAETQCTYDEVDRKVSCACQHLRTATGTPIGDGVSTSTVYYDAESRVVQTQDDNGHGVTLSYDSAGRPSSIADGTGNTRTVTYDASSDPHEITDVEVSTLPGSPPELFVTHLEHDALHQLTAVVDPLGQRTEMAYDSLGNLTKTTDPRGNVTRTTYDGMSRPLTTTTAMTDTGTGAGTVIDTVQSSVAYDDNSRPVAWTDPKGNVTTLSYDPRDRPLQMLRADGTISSWGYLESTLHTVTDPNGSVQTLEHDRNRRLVSRTLVLAPNVLGTTSETYRYDGRSRVVLAQDDDTLVTREYDTLSNLTMESVRINAGPPRITETVHDGVGNPTQVTRPSGHVVAIGHDFVDYDWNVKVIAVDGIPAVTYDFTGGRRRRNTWGTSGGAQDFVYDGARRLIEQSLVLGPGDTVGQSHGWDPASNRTSRHALAPGTAEHLYSYDSMSRLTGSSETLPGQPLTAVSYSLDDTNNRVLVIGGQDAGPYTMSSQLPEPADSQVNQYTATPVGSRSYDRNGNTVVLDGGTPQARTFSVDYRGRIVEVASTVGTTSYRYDAFGRRVERSSAAGVDQWVHDGDREIEERRGPDLRASWVYGASGEPAVMREETDLNSNSVLDTYYYHTDDLHNVMWVSNPSSTLVESYEYGDYGRPRVFSGAGASIPSTAIANPFLFRSMRLDPELRLYSTSDGHFDPRAGEPVNVTANSWRSFMGGDQRTGSGRSMGVGSNPWSPPAPSQGSSGPVIHWNLEVRVDRIEMK